ncbi:trypsin-like peptidase domain-containing protein [Streptacidiphilus sp. P02-A3a]|uniref:trypsin-like peptidase domain-containing protein n=1 Tax=Streptacidiphilus sp. P02-A3a TaxID=2704468 RepID=UPI0015FBE3F0|nr:trypsin-like peptidase domain-containing protein [Streptacidiphilus sp. P02-A3a]QMU69618.1 trypsin-like peptidase domain-containing protein [Streptacidiphilus sp. P02-A3a]
MELPPLEEFPAGPRRVVLEDLHALYRAAGGPGVRVISAGLAEGDFRATMNRDLVARVLSGRQWPTAWQQLDSLVRWLALRSIDSREPTAEADRFLRLYQLAAAERDGTVRAPASTDSTVLVFMGRHSGPPDWGLVGMGVVLANGTVLTRGHVADRARDDGLMVVVRLVSGNAGSRARVSYRAAGEPGFAVLTPDTPIAGAPGVRWGPRPSPGARVRLYLTHGFECESLWIAGTTMGPSGADGAWQLDAALPSDSGNPDGIKLNGFAGAPVLDDSGRVVGIVSRRHGQFVWMTPVDVIVSQMPSIAHRQPPA